MEILRDAQRLGLSDYKFDNTILQTHTIEILPDTTEKKYKKNCVSSGCDRGSIRRDSQGTNANMLYCTYRSLKDYQVNYNTVYTQRKKAFLQSSLFRNWLVSTDSNSVFTENLKHNDEKLVDVPIDCASNSSCIYVSCVL